MIENGSEQTQHRESSVHGGLTVLKFMELCLTLTCVALHYYSFNDGDLVTGFLATGTFCGFVVILWAVCCAGLMRCRLHKRLDMFFSVMGAVLFGASGVMVMEAWHHSYRTHTRDLAILKGAVAVINAVVFLLDGVYTFKSY